MLTNNTQLKEKVITFIEHSLQNKLGELKNIAIQLQNSLENESKSSAGDKHETGRAMLHLEQEKLQKQWVEIEQQLVQLGNLKKMKNQTTIGVGSFVVTKKSFFLIGIGLGMKKIDESTIFCVGITAPIGQLINKKKIGDKFTFNGQEHEIIEIC